jgi:low affinity Fe/Cu permease
LDAAFVAVHVSGLALTWQLLIGDVMTPVNLLLALLKNSERRAEHAIQRKLDSIAAGLLDQHEGEHPEEAADELRKVIRMEEEL